MLCRLAAEGYLTGESSGPLAVQLNEVIHTFGNLAKTRAVMKGELLRGMVSQGQPDPLRHSFKIRLCKKYLIFGLAILFERSVISGLARR